MEKRNSPFSNNEDRISKLPDTLIHHILSFIDMKYAVRTSVLSTRWRYIWTSLPTLLFRSYLFYSTKTRQLYDSLLDFVDRVLILRDFSDIQRFELDCPDEECDLPSRLETWILAAVKRNVQELSIGMSLDQIFRFPHCLFTCKSLTKLYVGRYGHECSKLILPNSIDLPRLKSMELRSLSFDDEKTTNTLFSSCPVLESLILEDCEFHHVNLNIYALELKHFELVKFPAGSKKNGFRSVDGKVTLYAPNLKVFRSNDYMSNDYCLENLASLVTADIYNDRITKEKYEMPEIDSELPVGVKQLYAERMIKFLRAVSNVKDLTLSPLFLEFASGAFKLFDSQPPQFCNLQCLKLWTSLSRDSMHAITYLLKISPNIESIFIEITQHFEMFYTPKEQKQVKRHPMYPYFDEINSANIGDYWKAGLSLPCTLNNVKYVEIRGVQGCINELMFLELLFKKARVLEEVVLFSCTCNQYCKKFPNRRWKRMRKFNEKLLKLPRESASIAILCRF